MAESDATTAQYDKVRVFDGTNFQVWKFQFQLLIQKHKLLSWIDGSGIKPEDNIPEKDAWEEKDIKAKLLISQALQPKHLEPLLSCTTSAGMWKRLLAIHEQRSELTRSMLLQKFYDARMDQNESVSTFIGRVENLAVQLRDMGETFSQAAIINKIVQCLPEVYSNFVTAWESTEVNRQTVDYLTSRLMNEETRLKVRTETESKAFLAGKFNMKPGPSGKQKKGSIAELKKKTACAYCKKIGHWAKECRQRIAEEKSRSDDKNKKKDFNHSKAAFNCNTSAILSQTDQWIADTGASEHMSYQRNWFVNYVAFDCTYNVYLGNDSVVQAEGRGDINIKSFVHGNWFEKYISGVLYVPKLKKNLFSIGACTDKGFEVVTTTNKCELFKDGNLEAAAVRDNGLYRLLFQVDCTYEANAANHNQLELWHQRLGHINVQTIKQMVKNGQVAGLTDIKGDDFFCHACQLGKQARKPFSLVERRDVQAGEFYYADLCGPMSKPSVGGALYFLLIKDDYSSYRHVEFLRYKSETFAKFKEFASQSRSITGRKIKYLRTDNGREFDNEQFKILCKSWGIKHEFTAPYCHEQVGRAERDNRTLVEAARSMIIAKDLNIELWAEATATASFCLNRTPNSQTKSSTPYELYTGQKPTLERLRVFGCDAYVHIPKEKRGKWDAKSKRLILVGYQDTTKNYRLWDPTTRKIVISRDVVFNESHDDTSEVVEKSKEGELVIPTDLSHEHVLIENEPLVEPLTGNNDSEISQNDNETDQAEISGSQQEEQIPLYHQMETRSRKNQSQHICSNNKCCIPTQAQAKLYEPNKVYTTPDGSKWLLSEKDNKKFWAKPEVHAACNLTTTDEPQTYQEAMQSNKANKWQEAMQEEMAALHKNHTWVLKPLPPNKKVIASKWVFKIKTKPNGSVERYKARLVAKGFTQKQGIDYQETYSPVVRFDSIRVILALAATEKCFLSQFDIKCAFLYGELEEELYIEQPEGFVEDQNLVCKLYKSLYGLKQAPKVWNSRFTEFLKKFQFNQNPADGCVYIGKVADSQVILALYVDDGLLISKDKMALEKVQDILSKEFEVNVCDSNYFVGLEIEQQKDRKQIFIHQTAYINRVLEKFNMGDCNAVSVPMDPNVILSKQDCPETEAEKAEMSNVPYREAVGSLMFAACVSRPDIMYAVSQVSKYLENPGRVHWVAVTRILRYLKGTSNYGLIYKSDSDTGLQGYSDADYARDVDNRRSVSGYLFTVCNGPVTWASQRQSVVAQSTTESEYVAASTATKELLWLRELLSGIGAEINSPTELFIDNQAAMKLIHNPEFHKRTKHIDVKFHFIRDHWQKGHIDVHYIKSDEQLADILTKPLPRNRFNFLRKRIGVDILH